MTEFNKEIVGKNHELLDPIGYFPNELIDVFLYNTNDPTGIAYRFVLLLISNLKEEQIIKKKSDKNKNAQLALFDMQLFDITDDSNQTKVLKFHYSDFLPKGNKNYGQVRQAIEELRNMKYSLTIDLNKSIKKQPGYIPRIVKFNSSLILNYVEEEKRGFKILIDKYWYRILINLTDGYNPYLKSLAFNLKSAHTFKFYFWLLKLPLIEESKKHNYKELYETLGPAANETKGTIVNVENFIEILKIPYKFESQIARDYLDIIRGDLNKFANISFNYKFENKKIYIVTYSANATLIGEGINKSETVKIKYAINFKVKNYHLDKTQALMLIELYLKYGKDFVTKATDKKKSLRGLEKEEYFVEFNNLVNKAYEKSKIPLQALGYSNDDKIKIRKELFKKFGDI